MAIMSMGEFRQIDERMRNLLKIVTEFAKVPGFLIMTNPKLAPAEQQRVKTLMLQFPATDEGRRFFTLAGFSSIREVTAAELASLDAVVEQTRVGLAVSK
jgi:ABC-type phosphate/phosphonate transport system substrate-binding protein